MNQSLIFIIIVSLIVLTIQTVIPYPHRIITKRKCRCGKFNPITGKCSVALIHCPPIAERPSYKKYPKGTSNSCYKDNSANKSRTYEPKA